jgi:hypothetical protein
MRRSAIRLPGLIRTIARPRQNVEILSRLAILSVLLGILIASVALG